ncbi:hypothetical protein BC830DRAFT_1175770 [Chytriomyces sp. MP71]|nr:hypothetical protein BC830DRAFT_1175770 [Chytriomyces sp. MP71]
MKALFVNEDGNVAFKPELLADFTDLVVPEILTEFASVRIPLIEFKDPQWEMRVEGIEVETKALLPSLCEIEFQNSVLFGLTRNVGYETANKVELKFHQITFNNPGLPFRAKSRKFVSVSENGYLDIDLANQGMTVTVNVTLFSTGPRVLQVNRVQADVEGLQIVIRDTHNELSAFTFNKHIVKLIKQNLKTVVEDEVRSVLEKWDRQLVVMRRAFM